MMDYELRKKRILFSDYYQKEEDDENKEGKDKEKIIKRLNQINLLKSNKKTTIIVGAPGSGKSTLLKYLVHKDFTGSRILSYLSRIKKYTKTEL